MNFSFFTPIKDTLVVHLMSQSMSSFGQNIDIHTMQRMVFLICQRFNIAILGVKDGRGAQNNEGCGEELQYVREKLYQLFPGNWQTKIADLGNIEQGSTLKDTYFAVKKTTRVLT